jgi:hypothetical protein
VNTHVKADEMTAVSRAVLQGLLTDLAGAFQNNEESVEEADFVISIRMTVQYQDVNSGE